MVVAGCSGIVQISSTPPHQTGGTCEARSHAQVAGCEAPRLDLAAACVDGKYRMLLATFASPQDAGKYGDFNDTGFSPCPSWAGYHDLPPGYWVYVHPFWYIWRDDTRMTYPTCNYGPEQATGAPDTTVGSEMPTAWCSRTPDQQYEWLLLEYDDAIEPTAIVIYQTLNPGAVNRVSALNLMGGEEVSIWTGVDTERGDVFRIPLADCFATTRVRVWLDSRGVAGFNAIDAVGLVDANGNTTWASAAHATSTYAEPEPGILVSDRRLPKENLRPARVGSALAGRAKGE
jgi:hypothetical protein